MVRLGTKAIVDAQAATPKDWTKTYTAIRAEFEVQDFGYACTTLAQTNLRNLAKAKGADVSELLRRQRRAGERHERDLGRFAERLEEDAAGGVLQVIALGDVRSACDPLHGFAGHCCVGFSFGFRG